MIPASIPLAVLFAAGALLWAIRLAPYLRAAMRRRRALALGLFALAFLYAAATKAPMARIFFLQPDADVMYLIDNGSAVRSDSVLIDFRRIVIPDSANLFIERREIGAEDTDPWTLMVFTTFAEFSLPHTIYLANATNYNFAIYTDWSVAPEVQTNGVWHATMGLPIGDAPGILAVRSVVVVDGEQIATPTVSVSSENNTEQEEAE